LKTIAEEIPTVTSVGTIPIVTNATSGVTLYWEKQIQPLREGESPRPPLILRKKLDAYQLTIENHRANSIQIITNTLPNHVSPELAYLKAKQSPGMAYTTEAVLGLAMAPLSFGVTLITGLFVFGPLDAAMTGTKNKKLLLYVNQFAGNIPLETILPGESKHYGLLTEKDTQPEIHLTVQDLKTGETLDLP
jgi:hypothetical protein